MSLQTITEIKSLRELDVLILKKIFGIGARYNYDQEPCYYPDMSPIKFYSTDLNVAWGIVEKLKTEKMYCCLDKEGTITFTTLDHPPEEYSYKHKEIGIAICVAALKSVGIEVELKLD